MMVILQPITTKSGDVMKFMVHGMRKSTLGSLKGTMKLVVGIIHLITTEYSL
jgi:hypothetical protein